jgi:hypothetical protein
MVKEITGSFNSIVRAATEHKVVPGVDFTCRFLDSNTNTRGPVAVRGMTLAGNLFLSILLAGGY